MDPVPLALGWIMFQAVAGSLNVADQARVYAREAEIGDVLLIEIENAPQFELGLAWPTARLDIDYVPRFLWVDIVGAEPSPTLLLHTAGLQLSLRKPRYAFSFTQTGAYGDQDFTHGGVASDLALSAPTTPLPGAGPTPPAGGPTMPGVDPTMVAELDLLPRPAIVRVAEEESSASLSYAWSRRLSTTIGASFGISGGADAAAQRVLPRQRRTVLDASLDYRYSPSDDLGTGLTLTQIETSNGYDHKLAQLEQSWATRWSERTGGELAAGAALEDTLGPIGPRTTKVVPVGSASVWHALFRRALQARFLWVVGYRPDVNILAGTLQSQLYTTAQAGLTVDRSSLVFAFGAAKTFPNDAPDANDLVSADLTFAQELLDWLSLELGGQLMWQGFEGDNPLAFNGSRWLLYGGFEARAPEVRF